MLHRPVRDKYNLWLFYFFTSESFPPANILRSSSVEWPPVFILGRITFSCVEIFFGPFPFSVSASSFISCDPFGSELGAFWFSASDSMVLGNCKNSFQSKQCFAFIHSQTNKQNNIFSETSPPRQKRKQRLDGNQLLTSFISFFSFFSWSNSVQFLETPFWIFLKVDNGHQEKTSDKDKDNGKDRDKCKKNKDETWQQTLLLVRRPVSFHLELPQKL